MLVGAAGLFLMVQLFPSAIGANYAFYAETLSPSSSASELEYRAIDYPLGNLMKVFEEHEQWPYGYGTGTASLGLQYVSRLLGETPPTSLGRERLGRADAGDGYPWLPSYGFSGATTLLFYAWRVVKQLRQTVYFPVALSILWYAFLLLFPFTHMGMQPYQNYVMNAYFWLLVGVLFRLPHLARAPQVVTAPVAVPELPGFPALARSR